MTFLLTLETNLSTGPIRTLSREVTKQVTVIALDPTGLAVTREMIQSSTLVANHPSSLVPTRKAARVTAAVDRVVVTAKVSVVIVVEGVVIVVSDKVVTSARWWWRATEMVTRHGWTVESRCAPTVPRHMSKHATVVTASCSASSVPRHPDRRAIRLNMSNSSARVALLRISGTGHGAEVRLMASLLAVVTQPLGFRAHTCVVAHIATLEAALPWIRHDDPSLFFNPTNTRSANQEKEGIRNNSDK